MLDKLVELIESLFSATNLNSPLFQIDTSWFHVDTLLLTILTAISVAAFLTIAIIWGTRAARREIHAGKEDLLGKIAEVKTLLKPKGTVLIQGELWKAILNEGQAKPGDEVVITKVDHLELWVTKNTVD